METGILKPEHNLDQPALLNCMLRREISTSETRLGNRKNLLRINAPPTTAPETWTLSSLVDFPVPTATVLLTGDIQSHQQQKALLEKPMCIFAKAFQRTTDLKQQGCFVKPGPGSLRTGP